MLLAMLALAMNAQTNLYYNKGEFVFSMAPTVTAGNLFNNSSVKTYGWSFESEYWEQRWTGTGLEVGSYNVAKLSLDHMQIMQDFRFEPFPEKSFFARLAIGGKMGAETYFGTGAKDVSVGPEIYWTFGKGHTGNWSWLNNTRLEADVLQHSSTSGSTAKICLQIYF